MNNFVLKVYYINNFHHKLDIFSLVCQCTNKYWISRRYSREVLQSDFMNDRFNISQSDMYFPPSLGWSPSDAAEELVGG